jgi:putative FmdB family regulatory protein
VPLRDYKCLQCNHTEELLIRSDADVPTRCSVCQSEQIEQAITAHGGYQFNSGPSSVTPKGSGSFKRSKE